MPPTNKPARALVFVNGDCDLQTLRRCQPTAADFVLCVDGGMRHCLAANLEPDLLVGDLDSTSAGELDRLRMQGVEIQRWPVRKDATDLELALDALLRLQQQQRIDSVVMLGMAGGRLDQSLANVLQLTRCHWPFDIALYTAHGDAWLLQGPRQWQQKLARGTVLSLLALGVSSLAAMPRTTDTGAYRNAAGEAANGAEEDTGLAALDAVTESPAASAAGANAAGANAAGANAAGASAADSHPGDCTGVYTVGLEYPLHNDTLRLGSTLGLSNVVDASGDSDVTEVSVSLQHGNLLLIVNPADLP